MHGQNHIKFIHSHSRIIALYRATSLHYGRSPQWRCWALRPCGNSEHFANERAVGRNPHNSSDCCSPALDYYTVLLQTHRLTNCSVHTQNLFLPTFSYKHNLLNCLSAEYFLSFFCLLVNCISGVTANWYLMSDFLLCLIIIIIIINNPRQWKENMHVNRCSNPRR